ncbi:hypothetical protein EGW08_010867 [Elysia chlorotica]|uniref:Endonuclease/exonuclease/phosphatase domain-containing protein n=1 Tax=Elysia chlorotica TaxID=188477 RepID=A0A433TII7_ELYCH|nr:hypothetical protein EGW08_010867 [Elysia chlorotica]
MDRIWKVVLASGETIIYSGLAEGETHMHGVALMMSHKATGALLSWEPLSPRVLTARFNSKGRKVTVIQCYAPTNTADIEDKEDFYEQIQAAIDKTPKRDMKILMGDLNAKVGADNTDRELIMGRHGVGQQNENGELFTEFCSFNDLTIGGTLFPHKIIHKTTWTSPDGKTENQIDHITIETWRVTKTNSKKIQGFTNRCLRNILGVHWPEVISNEELWERTRQTPVETEIMKRKWGWIGHTLRKPASNITRQALDWNPQGKRKVGRPKQSWRRSVEEEVKASGTTWAELKRTCQNRVRWRSFVEALCSSRNQEA